MTRPRLSGPTARAASEKGAKARPALAPATRMPRTNTAGLRERPATVIPSAASSPAATAVRRAPTPYDDHMARVQAMVQLSDELMKQLDAEAARRRTSRSGLIRGILDDYLREHGEARIGERIAEGYQRVPPVVPDEWGDPAEILDHAAVDLLHRLDAEERQDGHEPW